MVILSYEFALCFVAFFALYWLFYRHVAIQNTLLVIAAVLFIASWSLAFLVSLLFVWAVTQGAAKLTASYNHGFVVALAIFVLVAHLCFFKYTNFVIGQANLLGAKLTPLDIVMPLGVSFYTFQSISYLVDVYKGKMLPLPNSLALGFLSFVPTVVSGPIFRATDAQKFWYKSRRKVLFPYLAIVLIVSALIKKILLAGWLEALWVTPVFNNPMQFNGLEVLTGLYAYSLQLFFDFSGYTELAIALGLLLGFRLPQNFNRPYLATDIQDFWAKWHITLSTWIRDYIYIPLGGSRVGFWRTQFNLMAAFIISGVWHGAGWNFFVWGAIHGIALVWLSLLKRYGLRGYLSNHAKALAIFFTFHYVTFAWIFFRSESIAQASELILALGNFTDTTLSLSLVLTLPVMAAAWLIYPYLTQCHNRLANALQSVPIWLMPIVLTLIVVAIFSIAPQGLPSFIYANF